MKKTILFIALAFVSFFIATQSASAQTDTNNVATKSNEIVSLLTTKLKLTPTQVPLVQSLVTNYATKLSKSNAGVSSSSGFKQKVEKDVQSKEVTEFSTELPKLLTPAQATQYSTVKDKVATLFTQVK